MQWMRKSKKPAIGSVQAQILATSSQQAQAQTQQGGAPLAAATNANMSSLYTTLGILAAVAVIFATFFSFKKVPL